MRFNSILSRVLTCALGLVLGCVSCRGDAIATASLSVSELQLTPSAGTLILVSPWAASAYAEARNSLGELVQASDSSDGAASASAAVTWTSGNGAADPAALTSSGFATGHIPGAKVGDASATGRGSLFTFITVTGGTGTVDLNYFALLSGLIDLMTDANGLLAQGEVVFSLSIGDQTAFSRQSASIGPNSSFQLPVSGAVSGTIPVEFGVTYALFLEADAETRVMNTPEPGCAWLVVLPLATFFTGRGRPRG